MDKILYRFIRPLQVPAKIKFKNKLKDNFFKLMELLNYVDNRLGGLVANVGDLALLKVDNKEYSVYVKDGSNSDEALYREYKTNYDSFKE